MSLVTVSAKRRRVYERAFDHDEARRLHGEGWGYSQLVDHFGVSEAAVRRVCDPAVAERMEAHALAWNREHSRAPCKGGCGTRVWRVGKTGRKKRSGYCPRCWAIRRTADAVRDGELLCLKCEQWKPDEDFYRAQRPTRRGRKSWCKACENAARRAHRKANADQERKTNRDYKRREKRMTKFIVLEKRPDGCWKSCDEVEASSRLHAVERVIDRPGTFAAVTAGQLTELVVEPVQAFKVVRNGKPE